MKRRDIAVIITLIFLFFIVIILLETGKIVTLENSAYNLVSKYINPTFTFWVKIITNIGGPLIISILCIVLLFFHATRKQYGVPVIIVLILSYVINYILKNIFLRPRPDVLRLVNESSYSFPSGHSMINASIYTILVLLIMKNFNGKKKKIVICTLLIIICILIGISRIYLGVHYLGDVIAGWILGILVAFIIYLIIDKIKIGNK